MQNRAHSRGIGACSACSARSCPHLRARIEPSSTGLAVRSVGRVGLRRGCAQRARCIAHVSRSTALSRPVRLLCCWYSLQASITIKDDGHTTRLKPRAAHFQTILTRPLLQRRHAVYEIRAQAGHEAAAAVFPKVNIGRLLMSSHVFTPTRRSTICAAS